MLSASEVLHGTAEHFTEQMQQRESLPRQGTSYCISVAPWKQPIYVVEYCAMHFEATYMLLKQR